MEDIIRIAIIFAASYCFGALIGLSTRELDTDE